MDIDIKKDTSHSEINDANALLFHKNWTGLEIPESVSFDNLSNDNYGKFTLDPLHKGFGVTVGHSLRRVLLSSLVNVAVYAVKIEGVGHEYESISGIREDVLQIVLNIKELAFKAHLDDDICLKLQAKGPKLVTAKDIDTQGLLTIIDENKVICSLEENAEINMSLYLRMNRGFVSAEENFTEDMSVGTIFLDSNHSPIKKVAYEVQDTKLGKKSDHDKLIFEIWTNGGISPIDAVCFASKILRDYYKAFVNFDEKKVVIEKPEDTVTEKEENPHLTRSIEELELSVRSAHCLKAIKIKTIQDLVQKTESDMLKTKNFGRKSLKEIKSILSSMGLKLGMELQDIDETKEII